MDDRWRDTYDAWKTRSPDDDLLSAAHEDDEPEWNEFDDDGWEGWEIER